MALLTNQTLVNNAVSFFEDIGEVGSLGDALYTTDSISGLGLVIPAGGALSIVSNAIPVPPDSLYATADNFVLSASVVLSGMVYSTTALGLLTFQLAYNTNDGDTVYSSFNPLTVSNSITDIGISITTVVANTGVESSDLILYATNNTGASITCDYEISGISFIKLSTGGTTQL